MSETQIKKLTLKALKQDIPLENKEVLETEALKTDSLVTNSEWPQEEENTSPSLKISFDSIKKEEKNGPEQEKPKVSIETQTNETLSVKNEEKEKSTSSFKMSFDSIRKEEKDTPVETKSEDSEENKTDITNVKEDNNTSSITDENIQEPNTLSKQNNDTLDSNETTSSETGSTEDKTSLNMEQNTEKEEEKLQTPEEIEEMLLNTEKEVKKKSKLFWIFKRKEKPSIEENKWTTVEKKEEKVQFSNYESHFEKESLNFLEKFQNFKYTPKTRVWLILWLVILTISIIWGLMAAIPDKHSPEIYKASLLKIIWKEVLIDTPIKDNNPILEDEWSFEEITEEEELTMEGKEIKKQERSKERLRQHLLNKYSQ